MTKHIVRLDGAGSPSPGSTDETIELRTTGARKNVFIEPDEYVRAALDEIPPRLRDLFTIAGAIYAADARISRGSLKDAFNDAWRRTIQFHIGVHDAPFWTSTDANEALCEAVSFLTGDTVGFVFDEKAGRSSSKQSLVPADVTPPGLRQSDVVVLLSGGLDSLAAALEARAEGRRPLLVSHRPATVLQARQANVVKLLRARESEWRFPHLSILLHAVKAERPREYSQRSRAFLYASLGAIGLAVSGARELWLCDNGVVSLNLPPSGQSVGTTLSRSTHPGFLSRLEVLLRLVFEASDLAVRNTLLFRTKRQVVELVAEVGEPALIQETVSCTHTEGRTRGQPHCGVCTQCIDRRFATVAAGLQDHDLVERYERDIFVHELPEGTARTHVENYLRFAHDLRGCATAAAFAEAKLPDLVDALPSDGIEDFVQRVAEMFARHRADVDRVVEEKVREQAAALAQNQLPEHSLLRMLATAEHLVPPRQTYVEKLARLLAESLPAAFTSRSPTNETELQDAGESILRAAGEQLNREAPQVPFGVVSVRPDFSKALPAGDALFVEFKLIKAKKDRGRIHGEIAKDLHEYPEGVWILFAVFDPKRAIRNDSVFASEFERRRERVRVQMVR